MAISPPSRPTSRARRRSRVATAAAAVGIAAALGLGLAGPATALGSVQKDCVDGAPVYGNSNSIGATTVVGGLDQCERAGAQFRYWSNGVVRYSSWFWSHSVAYGVGPSGAIALGGKHTVEEPALLYAYRFPFTT